MNNGTEHFAAVIADYLDRRAAEDAAFAARREEVGRPIKDIVTYIINQVRLSGQCGFTDEEIFGIAMTAAEEADLDIGKPIACTIVSNRQPQLTAEERAKARQEAIEALTCEEMTKLRRPAATKKAAAEQPTPTLFDL